jgi:5-methylcytosine-specific restriction protein B
MEKELIDQIIKQANLQLIIGAPDFYFQKGQDALKNWLSMNVSDSLKKALLTYKDNYAKIQQEAKSNQELAQILKLLFEITSYCDRNAKDKHLHNKYDDKRYLALAFVRMNSWIEHLILLKLAPDELGVGSTRNAFNFLLDPQNNATILSENHRELVSKNLLKKDFNSGNFVDDLKNYFSQFHLATTNPENYTQLLSRIIYSIQDEWKEDVIALMASDSTGWQDERIEEMQGYDAAVIWNSKRPSGTNETLKFLRSIVDEGRSFSLYYSASGMVNYRATIIDFVENQQQLDERAWDKKHTVLYYDPNFANYRDEKKSGTIIFLSTELAKIKPIPVSKFTFYNGYDAPRQDNLSPIKLEPKEIVPIEPILEKSETSMSNTTASIPMNQILFGPPGTGKTYNTINKSLEIIGEDTTGKSRQEIKDLFDIKLKEGQIVFTTFHQSMSYEDFIEGIKPETIDQRVVYNIQNGIFKIVVNRSLFSFHNSAQSKTLTEFSSFDDLYDLYLEDLGTRLNNDSDPLYLPLRTKNYHVEILSIDETTIETKGKSAENKAFVEKEKLRLLYNRFKNIDEIKNVSEDVRSVGRGLGWSSNYYGVFKDLKEFELKLRGSNTRVAVEHPQKLSDDQIDVYLNSLPNKYDVKFNTPEVDKYVVIIDEINRGNVSQIFGELITLIEEDKRLGKAEVLKGTLPYSKEKFGVPPNLYIIGTMNTADRSVEALDAALRRRFSFTEMPPMPELITPLECLRKFWINNNGKYYGSEKDFADYEKDLRELLGLNILDSKIYIEYGNSNSSTLSKEEFELKLSGITQFNGIDLSVLLQTINNRIEKLLDSNHKIGHSYFMAVYSVRELKAAFQNKIIPLLQEYFFGDYGKIGLVLGEGFFEPLETDSGTDFFANFYDYDGEEFAVRKVFKLKNNANLSDEAFKKAINALLRK